MQQWSQVQWVQWVQWKDAIDRNGVCFSPILTEINGCQYVHYTYKDAIDEPLQLEEDLIWNGMISYKAINDTYHT